MSRFKFTLWQAVEIGMQVLHILEDLATGTSPHAEFTVNGQAYQITLVKK